MHHAPTRRPHTCAGEGIGPLRRPAERAREGGRGGQHGDVAQPQPQHSTAHRTLAINKLHMLSRHTAAPVDGDVALQRASAHLPPHRLPQLHTTHAQQLGHQSTDSAQHGPPAGTAGGVGVR